MMNDDESIAGRFYGKEGAPTEPGLCSKCGLRPGTVCLHNVTGALGEPPEPEADEWICRPCSDAMTVEGWAESVANVERLMTRAHITERPDIERAAARLAIRLHDEIERSGLIAPTEVRRFVERYGR